MSARRKPRLVSVETPSPIRLRIGIGSEEGFTNVERLDAQMPESVDAIYSAFHFHRLSQEDRFAFMNDAYRLLKPGAQLMMVMPHASSARSIIDPKSKWPPLREESFMVYNKAWREQEGMGDLGLTCDFVNPGVGHVDHPGLIGRNEDFVAYVKEHEVNWVSDLHVTLTKGA